RRRGDASFLRGETWRRLVPAQGDSGSDDSARTERYSSKRKTLLSNTKVCNTNGYRPYWVVHTGPHADRYANHLLPGDTIDWCCFCPKREKKRENLKIRRYSPDPDPSPAGDFFSPHGLSPSIDVREKHTIGAEGGASDDGQLLAGVDVLEDGLVEPGQMLVPFLEHCLDPVPRKPERHTALVLETPRGMEKDTVEIKARSEEIRNP
ncbi:hypothetical protein BHE74_00015443, partial [Ensete ventricosum]